MKKIVAVLLAMMLIVSMSVAVAAPSITTDNLVKHKKTSGGDGVDLTNDNVVTVVADTSETVAALAEVSEKINAGTALSEIFGAELDDALKLSEFITLKVEDYKAEHGDLKVALETPTVYTDGQAIKALALVDGAWIVLEGEVVDGEVIINFPADILEKLNGKTFPLAILA